MAEKRCELCQALMKERSEVLVADTRYTLWRCVACGHEVASAMDELGSPHHE